MILKLALYLAIGALLFAAVFWYFSSLYREFFQAPGLTVQIEVIGTEEEAARLEKGLALLVRTRLLKISEDINRSIETSESQRSEILQKPNVSPDMTPITLWDVANPSEGGLSLVFIEP